MPDTFSPEQSLQLIQSIIEITKTNDYQMLIAAFAILISYIIPGHLLRRQFYQPLKRKDYSV